MVRFAGAERGHAAARCSSAGATCLTIGSTEKKPRRRAGLKATVTQEVSDSA